MTDEDHEGAAITDWDEVDDERAELDDEASEELERIQAKLGLSEGALPRMIDGRYEILKRQGQGGMGVVYHARDTRLDRDVALKLVRSRPFSDDDRLRERIEREAKALAKLDGRDHVVAVYDVGRHKARIYFTMPFIEGSDLREWQDAGAKRSVDEIVDVYLQAARGLAEAHELGVVHRDFKPGNVLLRAGDNRVLVADFGIAEAVSKIDTPPEGVAAPRADERLTMTGAVLGTLPYVAPERIPGVDRAPVRGTPVSDQFSFCVALWEALTGKVPFEARTTAEMLAALERGPVGEAAIPSWLRSVLRRGLACDPEARFANMPALIGAIEGRRHARRRITLVTVSVGLVFGLLGSAALAFWPAEARSSCSSFAQGASQVWNQDRQTTIERALASAPESSAYVVEQLDDLTQRWGAAAQEACVDGYAPEPEDPARVHLDQWLHVADEYLTLLAQVSEPGPAERAGQLVDRLLLPTQAGFAGFSPPKLVKFEVWSAADSARAQVLLGDNDPALAKAKSAIGLARRLGGGALHTPELAEAYAARAEVLARRGELGEALADFEEADVQAHLSAYRELEIRNRAMWAKVQALADGESCSYHTAIVNVDNARRLLPAVTSPEQGLELEALLEDAAGYIEYRRDAYADALARHKRALELLSTLNRPILTAKTLNSMGAAQQMLDQWDEARAAYERAAQILTEATVPPGNATSLEVQFNLGTLAGDLNLAEGFAHLDVVVQYSSGAQQLKALEQALNLAVNLEDEPRTRAYAEELVDRMAAEPLDSTLRVRAHSFAAMALISLGDPRGDLMVSALADLPAELVAPELGLGLRRSHLRVLEERGRCDDAARVLADIDEYVSSHALADDAFDEWRTAREAGPCALAAFVDQ